MPAFLCAGLAICVGIGQLVESNSISVTLTEMLIRVGVVVGIYIFIGNSGIMSFGQIGFMCIGAYATAWATLDPNWKQIILPGLPQFLKDAIYPFPVPMLMGAALAAIVALVFGFPVMRLSGIAASIATFAFLVVINSVYSNWELRSPPGRVQLSDTDFRQPMGGLAFVCVSIVVACVFQRSQIGLMLRASRDDEIAARASAAAVERVQLTAFVISAFLIGAGGSLYAQFLGILTADTFYMGLTFITLAMLVIGGIGSLTGAVVGTVAVTLIIESLRGLEGGVVVAGARLALPAGSQEIGLGVVMALILIFRAQGLVR